MKDRLQDKNNIMMNRPQKQSNIQTSYKESQQAKQERPAVKFRFFKVQKLERQAIPFKKKPFKSQQLQLHQQTELHNVQSQKSVRLLFKEFKVKTLEIDHQ